MNQVSYPLTIFIKTSFITFSLNFKSPFEKLKTLLTVFHSIDMGSTSQNPIWPCASLIKLLTCYLIKCVELLFNMFFSFTPPSLSLMNFSAALGFSLVNNRSLSAIFKWFSTYVEIVYPLIHGLNGFTRCFFLTTTQVLDKFLLFCNIH